MKDLKEWLLKKAEQHDRNAKKAESRYKIKLSLQHWATAKKYREWAEGLEESA